VRNVHLQTSKPELRNLISSTNSTSYQDVGGLVGSALNYSLIADCSVENTVVMGTLTVGGIAAYLNHSEIYNCVNQGIPSNPSEAIAYGAQYLGGVNGYCDSCKIVKAGTKRGRIISTSSINPVYGGGIFGEVDSPVLLSQLHSHKDVVVDCSSSTIAFCGGIGGWYLTIYNSTKSELKDSYSTSTVIGATQVGGLVGVVEFATLNSSLKVSNSYSASRLILTQGEDVAIGNIVGQVIYNAKYSLTFKRVFFNCDENEYKAFGNGITNESKDGERALGRSSERLFNEIIRKFNKKIWRGDRLQAEFPKEHHKERHHYSKKREIFWKNKSELSSLLNQ